MKTILLYCLSLCIVSSGICQTVKIKKDESVDLTQYTTFRIDKGEMVTVSDTKIDEATFYRNVKQAITEELTRRGYRAVEDSTAELVISYVGEAVKRMDTEDLGPLGQSPVTDPSGVNPSRNWSREYHQGSIVIQIRDVARKKEVWQARSSVEIVKLGDGRALGSVIYKCFRKYPSKKSKKKK